MTHDDSRFAPPHELGGFFGQVIDPGGGGVPGMPPAPLPGALGAAGPGLAAAALEPPALSGPDDPRALALAIERIAGELLAMRAAGEPGAASPGRAAAAPESPPLSGPDDPRALALAIEQIAGELLAIPAGGELVSVPLAPAGALTASHAPQPKAPEMAPPSAPSMPMTPMAAPAIPTSSIARSPFTEALAFGDLAFGEPVFGTSSFDVPGAGIPGFDAPGLGVPDGAAPPLAAGQSSPLASIGSLAMLESIQLPFLTEAPAIDAAPAFLPGSPGLQGLPGSPGLQGLPGLPGLPAADAVGADTARGGPASASATQPAPVRSLGGTGFDPYTIRRDFPILEERVHGSKHLVWLDNAATTQKPRQVIERLLYFYEHENSNIHRAAHALAARASDAYEASRESVRRFLHAGSTSEIVFVRGATEGINLVAQSWGRRNITAGDEIVLTHLEHHANIVPWQQLCAATGARLRIAPVDDRGDVLLDEYERLLGDRTRLVAFPQVSNALGTVTPAREMIEIAHRYGALVLLDGAQAVSHMQIDVQLLDCDFYVFSGHKVFAPTGIGAVFGKRALLNAMPPWQGGGNMIQDVTFERTSYQQPAWRFEAGTGSIADAVGLGAALDYVMRIGLENIHRYEHGLLEYAERRLSTVSGLRMIGNPRYKAGVLSFVLDGQRTEEVGSALDKEGIAVRSGHHCAQPILRRFGVEASVRASLAFYNICEDIDALVEALHKLQAGRR